MSYSMKYNSENNCIMASMEGRIDQNTVKEFALNIVEATKKHNCRKILNDIRKVNLNLSTIEIYELPKKIKEAGLEQFTKRALVVGNNFEDVAFFETVSFNQAQNVKIFRDPEAALEWLKSTKY